MTCTAYTAYTAFTDRSESNPNPPHSAFRPYAVQTMISQSVSEPIAAETLGSWRRSR